MINVEFEWDPEKSRANLEKHGIDFESAIDLWQDKNRIEFRLAYIEEDRFAVIGELQDKVWTAIATLRGHKIRLISVRRARDDERQNYDKR